MVSDLSSNKVVFINGMVFADGDLRSCMVVVEEEVLVGVDVNVIVVTIYQTRLTHGEVDGMVEDNVSVKDVVHNLIPVEHNVGEIMLVIMVEQVLVIGLVFLIHLVLHLSVGVKVEELKKDVEEDSEK